MANSIDGKVFASKAKSGEIADFPDIERGWGVTESTGFIPTMEHFNGFGKRIDLHINELNKIKANINDVFTKLQSDERYLKKEDKEVLDVYSKQESDDRYLKKGALDNISFIPVGTIIQSASQITPQGYLKCNGASISRDDYKKLFEAIGTIFGSDDSNTFKLPDLRGRFVRGFSDGSSIDSNREFGSIQEDDLKRHTHAFPVTYSGRDTYIQRNYNVLENTTQNLFAVTKDGEQSWHDNAMVTPKDQDISINGEKTRGDLTYTGNSDEVRVKNIALNFYIKY